VRRALLVALALLAACGDGGGGGESSNAGGADDPCALLTADEVTEIMAAEPFDPGGVPGDEEGVCNWETDPNARENYFYLTLQVETLDDATEGYPDLRTAIDERTNVEIIDVDGLGDEAYATKSPLADAGTVDGLWVAVDDTVLRIGWQSQEPVERDTPRFEDVLDIAEKAIDRL
jgi:hypothetical protein